jgi:hypothetical protein
MRILKWSYARPKLLWKQRKRRKGEQRRRWKRSGGPKRLKRNRKAEEAEAQRIADKVRKAEEAKQERQAEQAWEAEAAAEKERAAKAQAKNIQATNEAMQARIEAHEANKKRVAEDAAAVRIKAQALVTHQKNLAKLSVPPNDQLMQVPEGPEPSLGGIREDLQRRCPGFPETKSRGGQRFGKCSEFRVLVETDFCLGTL